MSARTIFVDVDDTLIRSVGSKRVPMPRVVEAVRHLHAQGNRLFLWRTGGADYARASADELGIAHCFEGYLPKPEVDIDDQAMDEWRHCQHVLPGNADGV